MQNERPPELSGLDPARHLSWGDELTWVKTNYKKIPRLDTPYLDPKHCLGLSEPSSGTFLLGHFV
jgi:hypothetical protein